MIKPDENALSAALAVRWEKYREELKICKNEFSEEAVHDLRVATRRLLAALGMLRALAPHPRVQKARRTLKNQLDSLDELRDTHVMLVDVSKSLTNLPHLKSFEEYLLAREAKLLRRARKQIKEIQISKLKRRIEKSREALEETAGDAKGTVRLLSVVDQAYARARQAFGQVDASQTASIHRFRVTFKNFRYMVEIVNPVLEGYPEAYLKQMHDYQTRMGDVQDAEVFLAALAEFDEHMPTAPMSAEVRKAFENRRAEMIIKFIEGKEEIDLFWRAEPEQKFSWEQNNEPVHRSSRHRRRSGDIRIRRRQPASVDRPGAEENGKDRAGVEESGSGTEPDPHKPVPARGRHRENPSESV